MAASDRDMSRDIAQLMVDAALTVGPDRAVRSADRALGSDALSGAIYTHLGTLTRKPPTEDELATVARVIKGVARYAAQRDVSLGIEAINRYETYLINLASQAEAMLERIDEPNVFVHLDTYHMNIEEKGFYEPIVATGSRMQYIHLSESDRGTPGGHRVRRAAGDGVIRGGQRGHHRRYRPVAGRCRRSASLDPRRPELFT